MPERYHIGMKIKESGVALSHIVEIGENLAALSARTGAEYLRLNRGINSVVNIDLREVIAGIDCNAVDPFEALEKYGADANLSAGARFCGVARRD